MNCFSDLESNCGNTEANPFCSI